MKKVLFITYHFPPDASVGGQRALKFAKYLPEYGWEPYILTTDYTGDGFDASPLDGIKQIKIFKVKALPGLRDLYLRLKYLFSKTPDRAAEKQNRSSLEGEDFLGRLKRYLISLTVLLVDDKKNWIAPAFLKALTLVRTHKIDYVVTSGPPHSSHLIGLALKKISGVKWAADFRDPWTDVLDFKPRQARCALSDKLDRVLERKVILGADKVFTTTEPLMNRYLERYKGAARKIRLLTNGFDAKRFSPGVKPGYDRFTITYAGTLYYNRTPEPLFKAIAKLVSEKKIRPNDITIKLIGNCSSVDGRSVAEIAREYGLGNAVELPGYLSQSEVSGIMRRSHLLLVLAPNQPLAVPAKVYDCIASGTDILALTDEGGTKDLINGIKAGCCFSHSEIDDISRYIHESMKSRATGDPLIGTEAHKQFDIRIITRKLSEELS